MECGCKSPRTGHCEAPKREISQTRAEPEITADTLPVIKVENRRVSGEKRLFGLYKGYAAQTERFLEWAFVKCSPLRKRAEFTPALSRFSLLRRP